MAKRYDTEQQKKWCEKVQKVMESKDMAMSNAIADVCKAQNAPSTASVQKWMVDLGYHVPKSRGSSTGSTSASAVKGDALMQLALKYMPSPEDMTKEDLVEEVEYWRGKANLPI